LTRAIGGTGYDFAWGKQDDVDSIAAIHRSLLHCVYRLGPFRLV
jgi:hypothetical protein